MKQKKQSIKELKTIIRDLTLENHNLKSNIVSLNNQLNVYKGVSKMCREMLDDKWIQECANMKKLKPIV